MLSDKAHLDISNDANSAPMSFVAFARFITIAIIIIIL